MRDKKFLKGIFAILMGIVITANTTFTAKALFSSGEQNNGYAIASFSKNDQCGTVINFAKEDFTSRISTGASLDGIVITALPATDDGVLMLGSREVLNYEGIASEQIESLRFVPVNTQDINSKFSFMPVFEGGQNVGETAVVTMNLSAKSGTAPIAENLAFETYKNVTICGKLKATDAEGGMLIYKIIDNPKYAQVVIENDCFRYTPTQNKSGKDSFKYVATDAQGNTSDAAIVTVKINKRSAKDAVTYSDMENSTQHYAAICLSEMGIMKGEQIGSCYFFNPNQGVTRGEFLAMAVLAADLSVPTVAVNTGLYDDAKIPMWVKPYVSTALNCGIINGSLDKDGNHVFLADRIITRAEAAVILNNIAGVTADDAEMSFNDAGEIPVWASQAVANLDAAKIMSADSTGSIRPCQTITREDAAQMIYSTINLLDSSKNQVTFTTWLKA